MSHPIPTHDPENERVEDSKFAPSRKSIEAKKKIMAAKLAKGAAGAHGAIMGVIGSGLKKASDGAAHRLKHSDRDEYDSRLP